MARILATLALLAPLAALAHPDHGPHWHASDAAGYVALAAVMFAAASGARVVNAKRGA